MFTSKDDVLALLTDLGARLEARGVHVELYLVGGAAMLIGYDRLAITRDIDAVITPPGVIDDVVEEIARERGDLPPDWLNDAVLPLLPRLADARSWEALAAPGITVTVASPEHLLAMKVRAGRGARDLQDIAVLCEVLGLTSVDEVWEICDTVWGPDMIRPDVRDGVSEFLATRGLA